MCALAYVMLLDELDRITHLKLLMAANGAEGLEIQAPHEARQQFDVDLASEPTPETEDARLRRVLGLRPGRYLPGTTESRMLGED